MPTMLNKVLAGKQDGSVDLWNIRTGKLIYTIPPSRTDSGPVTALQPTPALALLAVAYADGSLCIHDIQLDKEIIRLNSDSPNEAAITSISFRTDGLGAGVDGRKAGVMATASSEATDVTLWDLNNGGRVTGVLRGAHNPSSALSQSRVGGITKVEFMPSQPVLVTSGLDNALKSWIIDETPFSPVPRILHSRAGHASSITCLEFLPVAADDEDATGKWLLSAGKDHSLCCWSLRKEGQSSELSQGKIASKARHLGFLNSDPDNRSTISLEDLKAPEITSIACSLNRDGGMGTSSRGDSVWTGVNRSSDKKASGEAPSSWESIITGHKGDKYARTWFWGKKRAGRWAFETTDGTVVKSVAITPCGTFAIVGSAAGGIDVFNMQSGIRRQRFPQPLTPAQARKVKMKHLSSAKESDELENPVRKYGLGEGRHTKDVTGLAVDGLNRTVVSCSLDGKIKFWDFITGILQHEIDWHPMTAITACRLHRPSDLLSLSCDDLSIRVVDIETKRLVRELWGCTAQISDHTFSNDGRWMIASSVDSILRVWDLPTGHLINAVRVESVCTALAFSSTDEFLATAHVDGVGINLWSNRTLFSHAPTRHLQEDEIVEAVLPTSSGEGGEGLLDALFEPEEQPESQPNGLVERTDQLSEGLMTLSLVPRNQWQTLLNLDLIRQRNKPTEPPKAPEKAPFFLPALDQSKPTSSPRKDEEGVTKAERSRITKLERQGHLSTFTTLLHSDTSANNHSEFIEHLKSLSPSTVDIEIRSLSMGSSSSTNDRSELTLFVNALTARLRQRIDYELVQAWMAVFLRIHGEVVAHDAELVRALERWRGEQIEESERLNGLIGYCSGVLGFFRSARV